MFLSKREEGFTLVEILVAMVIFVIIVLAMSVFFLASYSNVILAGKKSTTICEAQQGLERAVTDPAGDEEEIEREPGCEIEIFGEKITGTKITVKKIYYDEHGRKVNYVTFIPEQ